MSKMRKFFERYERGLLIGLVIFVLLIFTVTSDITNWMRGLWTEQFDPTATAGTFSILPGETITISYRDYDRARANYSRCDALFTGGGGDRVKPSEVWTHLVLLHAARREGITVSNLELTDALRSRIRPRIFQDRPLYKSWIRDNFRVSPAEFEEGVREFLTGLRVRDLYRQSFLIAPPATREQMVKQYAGRNIEFARASWIRLPVSKYLAAAGAEFGKLEDPDKELKSFFEKDAAVKANRIKFRSPTRYKIEILATAHKKVTEESVARFKAVFHKTWPELDMGKLEPTVGKMREYFGLYQDRLLEQAGTTIEEVPYEDPEKKDDDPKKDDEPKKDEPVKEDPPKEDDGEPKKDEEPKDEEPKKEEPKEKSLTQAQREARFNRAFNIVREQIEREQEVKNMFWHMQAEAAKDSKKSLKDIFDKLAGNDDAENPICSTETDKGLLHLLSYDAPKTGEEIENIAIYGDKLTHNGRLRVTSLSDKDLPKVSEKPETAGMEAQFRAIFRLISVEQARHKTFDELDDGEKQELRKEFYLPHNARERAKAVLDELRKKCETGDITPSGFRGAGESLGGHVIENEWVLASSRLVTTPVEGFYWKDEFLHMRDRYFLRRALASVLGPDRANPKFKSGSYLPVQMDAREDAEDPGAAYLILLLERKKPDADTMPLEEFDAYIRIARQQRDAAEQDRWQRDWPVLMKDFNMEFFDSMQKSVEAELEERKKADKRGRSRP